MVGGATAHGQPQVAQEGHVGRGGKRGKTWAGGEIKGMDGLRSGGSWCVWYHGGLEYRRTVLDSGVRYNTVCEEGCSFVAARVRDEKKASETRQRKREAEEVDKVEVAPEVTIGRLETFHRRVDWTPRTPEAASAALIEKPGNPERTVLL